MGRYILAIILSFFPLISFAKGAETAIQLKILEKKISGETILTDRIVQIANNHQIIAFLGRHNLWVQTLKKQKIQKIEEYINFSPPQDVWYDALYLDDQYFIISISTYTEARRKADSSQSLGDYKEGPKRYGIIFIDLVQKKVDIFEEFKVSNYDQYIKRRNPFYKAVFTSAYRDGNFLYMGSYGQLTKLDLLKKEIEIIFEDELACSRESLFKEDEYLFYCANEGGLSGAWIEILNLKNLKTRTFCPLDEPYIDPDSIIKYKGKYYCSTLAGLLEITKDGNTLVHYQIGKDTKKMAVYDAKVINNQIWALRSDGLVKYNLETKSAIIYKFHDKNISNDIYSLHGISDVIYIGTADKLIKAESSQFKE